MLKFILSEAAEFEKLPAEHQALYTEDGAGRWVLQVEGAVPKKQLDDFRQTNIDLRKQIEAFGDIKPEDAKAALAKKAEFEAGTDPKKIEELVIARVGDLKKTHETEVAALKAEQQKTKERLAARLIDAALIEAGTKAGLRTSAAADLTARGRAVFQIGEDGESIVALGPDGQPLYGNNGERLNPTTWIQQLSKEASHLFEASGGGGATPPKGGGGGGGGGGTNPWAKTSWNLTEQGRILREDRAKAKALAASQGVNID